MANFLRFSGVIFRRLFLQIILIIPLLLAILFFLLFTETGFRFVPKLVNYLTPYKIEYKDLNGNILNQNWNYLTITYKDNKIFAKKLLIDSSIFAGFSSDLVINKIEINDADVKWNSEEKNHHNKSENNQNILPFKVFIKQADINKLNFNGYLIDKLNSSIEVNKKNITFKLLANNNSGEINVLGNFSVNNSEIFGKVNGEMLFKKYPKSYFVAEVSGKDNLLNLTANSVIFGDSFDVKGNIDLTKKYINQIKISSYQGNKLINYFLPELTGDFNTNAIVRGFWNNPQININVSWDKLFLQKNKQNIVVSDKGNFVLNGGRKGFNLNINGISESKYYPLLKLKGNGFLNISNKSVNNIKLVVNGLNGDAELIGDLSFDQKKHKVSWNSQITTNNIYLNDLLAKFLDKVPEKLPKNFISNIDFSGVIDKKSNPTILVNAKGLADFSDYLSGGNKLSKFIADFIYQGKQITFNKINIKDNGNQINLTGKYLNKKLNLTGNLLINNTAVINQELIGNLQADIAINGEVTNLQIVSKIIGKDIIYKSNKISNLTGNLVGKIIAKDINLTGDFLLDNIFIDKQKINQAKIKINGTLKEHQINLIANNNLLVIDGKINGSLVDKNWQAKINDLSIARGTFILRNKKPISVLINKEKITIDDICLNGFLADFCVKYTFDKQHKFDYQIDKLSEKIIELLFPKATSNNFKINGNIAGKGSLIWRKSSITGEANLVIDKSQVIIANRQKIDINPSFFLIDFNNQDVDISGKVNFDNLGDLLVNLKIADIFNQQQLNGKLTTNIYSISNIINPLNLVNDISAQINGDLFIGGTIKKPLFDGRVDVSNGQVKIPQYATAITNINLSIIANKTNQLNIIASGDTPEGKINLNGLLNLSPINLRLNLEGQKLLLANTARLYLTASPNLNININPKDGMIVDGVVVIPSADISVPDLSRAQLVSKDVVLVNKKNIVKNDINFPIKSRVEIILSNSVFFKSRELKVRLLGKAVTNFSNNQLLVNGVIEINSGNYQFYGRELNISYGKIIYDNNPINKPSFDLVITRQIDSNNIGVQIVGKLDNLKTKLISDPPLPDTQILSYLLFGRLLDDSDNQSALLQIATSIATTNLFSSKIAEKIGLDAFDLGIDGLKVGKYITSNFYLGMQTKFFEESVEFLAKYKFNRHLSVELKSNNNSQEVDFLYQGESN